MSLINVKTGKPIRLSSKVELKTSGSYYAFALSWGDYEVLADSKDLEALQAKLSDCLIAEGVARRI